MFKSLVLSVVLLSTTAQAGDAILTWTAPGDDGAVGTATTYDLRRSATTITAANFSAATQVTGLPAPKIAGSTETFTVTGLTPGVYYFAIKTVDEAGNWSLISNVISKTVLDTTPPGAIADLR
jgi:hypothetical protein